MYSSEYTSGFSWPAASHLVAPPSPRHESNVGQAPSRILKKSASRGKGVARCPFCSQNAHDETVLVRCAQGRTVWLFPRGRSGETCKTLARAHGTSRRASGWAGENVARSGGLIRAILNNVYEQAWKDHLWSVAVALPAERRVLARRGWAGEMSSLFEHPAGLFFTVDTFQCRTYPYGVSAAV